MNETESGTNYIGCPYDLSVVYLSAGKYSCKAVNLVGDLPSL